MGDNPLEHLPGLSFNEKIVLLRLKLKRGSLGIHDVRRMICCKYEVQQERQSKVSSCFRGGRKIKAYIMFICG